MPSLTARLTAPTPTGTLVFLRIALGLLGGGDMLGNGIYFHWYKDDFSGFTFPYYGFEWVQPLPEPFMSLFFIVGFLLGLAVALGWRFRITAPLFAAFFTYFFLLEKAHYLNHAYLFIWLAWVLCLTPAWRNFSLDVRRQPDKRATRVPAWSVYVFPALMGIVYFWGGIAKMNYDWLIEAMPLHMWLERREDMRILGPLWAEKTTAYCMAWGGMLLDLTVPFLLLHRRLRWVALFFLFFFHATNHLIFNIGIFPYLSMVLTSMWFAPDWPTRFVRWLGFGAGPAPAAELVPPLWAGTQVQGEEPKEQGGGHPQPYMWQAALKWRPFILGGLITIFTVHNLLPLRNHLFASDVNWSENGHRYSWRMMLRSKQGYGSYRLVDKASGETTVIQPRDSLSNRQYRKMATHPDMILQYAHHLRDQYAATGQDVAVYAAFTVRLNGRKRRRFIDPDADLSEIEWIWWGDKSWVLNESRSDGL